MRVITTEEHFQHPEAITRVVELSGRAPISVDLPTRFTYDKDSAQRLGGSRIEHMDRVGIDIQVVSAFFICSEIN